MKAFLGAIAVLGLFALLSWVFVVQPVMVTMGY